LPYTYVLSAVINLGRSRQEELHNYERPIAYLAYQQAEMNRDRKKNRRPGKISDHYFYENQELSNMPEPRYGAAAMAMIKDGLFPPWALFVYKDLKERAGDALPPEVLCLQCEDVLLLAPDIDDMSVTGMLVAAGSASEGTRTLRSPCGIEVDLVVPKLSGMVEAIEDAELRLIRLARRPPSC
jgi:hypothetical protein